MWLSLLKMLGKGPPPSGDSFTTLSCNGTPGRLQTFSAKAEAGQSPSIFYYLKYIARMV
jgi:hypothetical protein